MSKPRILVAGVGNIFLGDDAFGVEVVRRLAQRPLPDAVRVVDFGIRGLDLAYALLEDFEAVILVDACPRGGAAGSLYVIEPDCGGTTEDDLPCVQTHGMDPVKVLHLASAMGGCPGRVLLVGCEPSPCDDVEEMRFEMSEPVSAAVDEAVRLVEAAVAQLMRGEPVPAG
jgi:hydrogenase maturation protease